MTVAAVKKEVPEMNGELSKFVENGLAFSDVTLDEGNSTQTFFCGGKIPDGLPVEQWSDSPIWRKVTPKLAMYSRIVCIDVAMTKWAEFLVVDLDKRKQDVRLLLLRSVDLPQRKRNALAGNLAADFEVVVGVDGYRGRRKADHQWLGPWQRTEDNAYRDILEVAKRPQAR